MEYINGEIVLLTLPSTFHQDISGNLYVKLRDYLRGKDCKVFYTPFDVHFYKHEIETPDVMQPDLLIACDLDGNINEKAKYMGTPTLCVEILSKSTRSKDMVEKLKTFTLSGVKEFWVVDPKNETVIVYTFNNYEIEEYALLKGEETLQSFIVAGLQIPPEEIFEQWCGRSYEKLKRLGECLLACLELFFHRLYFLLD